MIIYISVVLLSLFLLFLAHVLVQLAKGRCKSNTCLIGKTAIVTGGNAGIGFEVALALAGRGCRVIIADIVDSEQSRQDIIKITDNSNVVSKHIDLASFASIREFTREIKENEQRLDILINNAGCGFFTKNKTEDGCNVGMQVNHLGSFLLTHLLIDLLKRSAPSRIIFATSLMAFTHNLTIANFNDPAQNLMVYGNSKLCNIIAARGFAEKLAGTGVTSNSAHPGFVRTMIFGKVNNRAKVSGIIYLYNMFLSTTVLPLFGKTAEEGAQTILHLALSKDLERTTGMLFSDCAPFFTVPSMAQNQTFCQEIWSLSERLCKLEPNERLQLNC